MLEDRAHIMSDRRVGISGRDKLAWQFVGEPKAQVIQH